MTTGSTAPRCPCPTPAPTTRPATLSSTAPCAWPSPTAPSPGDRLEAYRRGEISLTGRPVLTGPMSPPDPDTGPAIVREALERKQQADIARDAAERAAAEAARRAEEAERARQLEALSQLQDETPAESEDSTP